MKNKVKFQISTLAVLALLLAPSLTYAVWRSPSTWFKKPATPPVAKVVQVATTTTASNNRSVSPTKQSPATLVAPVVSEKINPIPKTGKVTPTVPFESYEQQLQRFLQKYSQYNAVNDPDGIKYNKLLRATSEFQTGNYYSKFEQAHQFLQESTDSTVRPNEVTSPQQTARTQNTLPTPAPIVNTPPPNTTFCNGTNWSRCPVGQDFVCPSSGNAYCQLPQQQVDLLAEQQRQQQFAEQQRQLYVQQQAAQQEEIRRLQAEQQRNSQISSLLTEYRQKENDITQQILNIKQKYYQDVSLVEKEPVSMPFIIGRQNQLLNEANRKIEQLNLQLDQLKLDYQKKIQLIQ